MADKMLRYILKLLKDDPPPELDEKLSRIPEFCEIYSEILSIREILSGMKSEERIFKERETRLQYLANHDSLTGAVNRRAFMEQALIEIQNNIKNHTPCGVVMMDLDFFKKFNDTYGHIAGDKVLRHLVALISASMRKNDFLGRYGGEEFLFFFDNADKKTGVAIAERFRRTLESSPVQLETGPAFITASFGVASIEDEDVGDGVNEAFIEELINHADQALYQAKNLGRNKVVSFNRGGDAKINLQSM
ncbi:MAG: GGDEF domain-containing protein [Treponema sp.]|jgi:diguanylate cyclase (GGDEF)-like protein|nr:GGDEF domain-containing protein [Treponema sp.]